MTTGELIERLFKHPLDAPVTVFYDRYAGGDYKQGEEELVMVVDGDYVMIAAESDEGAARGWLGRGGPIR